MSAVHRAVAIKADLHSVARESSGTGVTRRDISQIQRPRRIMTENLQVAEEIALDKQNKHSWQS
jgi:hypothetical protein